MRIPIYLYTRTGNATAARTINTASSEDARRRVENYTLNQPDRRSPRPPRARVRVRAPLPSRRERRCEGETRAMRNAESRLRLNGDTGKRLAYPRVPALPCTMYHVNARGRRGGGGGGGGTNLYAYNIIRFDRTHRRYGDVDFDRVNDTRRVASRRPRRIVNATHEADSLFQANKTLHV